jgi:hypothetical protein
MDKKANHQLPIGRAALAKALCAEWISEHSKTILLSLITLIFLSFFLFQLVGRFSKEKTSNYLQVQKAFHAWVAQESQDPSLLNKLEQPLKSHPELEAKFGTHIAQRLLGLGQGDKANPYANAALNRSKELTSPYYSRFSQNTLRISQGKYAEALQEAKRLKEELEGDDLFWEGRDPLIRSGTILYAYNLLRIASLEGELGYKEGELKAWEELAQNAGWQGQQVNNKTYDPEAYRLLVQNFTQGDISLLDFIEERKKTLKK